MSLEEGGVKSGLPSGGPEDDLWRLLRAATDAAAYGLLLG
jgi:hypothetical protein